MSDVTELEAQPEDASAKPKASMTVYLPDGTTFEVPTRKVINGLVYNRVADILVNQENELKAYDKQSLPTLTKIMNMENEAAGKFVEENLGTFSKEMDTVLSLVNQNTVGNVGKKRIIRKYEDLIAYEALDLSEYRVQDGTLTTEHRDMLLEGIDSEVWQYQDLTEIRRVAADFRSTLAL